ncbi:MAG TPA: class E sortase [Acidimicrobiales bacterium]|nr:class E sortase [Acidimicrobiales bacterium]
MDALIRFLRANPWARRGLSGLSAVLLMSAVGVLGYPVYTNLYRDRVQSRLDREIASPQLKQAYEARKLEDGDPLTRIKIPAIGVDTVVVEGTSASALRAGAGHYPETPLPCEAGNVAIAGHRTTYGKPFSELDKLKTGDVVILETPVGSCTYEITVAPRVILPTDLSVVANTPDRKLVTLTTCHPRGSARQRLYVQATLTKGTGASA